MSATSSTKALRQLFRWIEKKYGGTIPMEPVDSKGREVIVVARGTNDNNNDNTNSNILQTQHLLRLMQHDALAIHIKEFYPKTASRDIAQQILHEMQHRNRTTNWQISNSGSNRGLESTDVTTIGEYVPYNIVASSSASASVSVSASTGTTSAASATANLTTTNGSAIEQYLDGVQREHIRRRYKYQYDDDYNTTKEPFLWPLDLLRLQLDEAWPAGAGLARHVKDRRPYGGGLPRIMIGPTKYKNGFIHVDDINPMSITSGLFSANIYLQLPSRPSTTSNDTTIKTDLRDTKIMTNNDENNNNRVLEIWPTRIMSRWDWYRNGLILSNLSSQDIQGQVALRQALSRNNTESPVHIPNVESGDCILFSVQRPHAAIGFTHGIRISLQCFIQYNGLNERLLIDS